MNISKFARILLASVMALSGPAWAEDIDLFLGVPPSATDAPNVLIILDNTANWNQPFNAEMTGLQNVFNGLPSGKINVGLMLFTETGNPNNNIDGGYIRAAIRLMEDSAGTNSRQLYANLINGLGKVADKSNNGKAGLAMYEAHQYFGGLAPHGGTKKEKTDYNGNTDNCCGNSKPVWALPGNALNSFAGTKYNTPIDPKKCGKNYIIFISNGATMDNSNAIGISNSAMEALQSGASTQIGINPSGSAKNPSDEWARYMKNSNLGVTTFTVDIITKTTGQTGGWSALMKSMAKQSGGKYYTSGTGADLQPILDDIFNNILAVNSVFASVALPAASNAQSTFLNQVFIGQFRPDKNILPRWPGNLKQYKLGLVNNEVKVLDAADKEIVEPLTGFIQQCTRSYWTPATADSYWAFDPKGSCSTGNPDSNSPDGPIVEKGGQGYTVRAANPTTRKIYTCDATLATCGGTASMPLFENGNTAITAALLDPNNPLTTTQRTELINWGRGVDLADENGNSNSTEMRPSVHPDIVHSRPVAINYTTPPALPEVVVFYGGNEGMLRAINGNRSTTHNSTAAGHELWAFMPPEFYPNIKRIRDNTVLINVPASGTSAGSQGAAKPYGMDGPITAFEGSIGGTPKVYIYAGMRRSARVLYAFDVTNPALPKMLWKLGCPKLTDDVGCSGAKGHTSDVFTKIGQTWSTANIIYADGYRDGSSNLKPMLIVGGGYDKCEDVDNNSTANHACTASDKGNVIYLLDAADGELLQTFTTDRAVVGEVRTVTLSEASVLASYAYAADTGGNVYRISAGTAASNLTTGAPAAIGTTAPGSWVISKIAALGCGGQANSSCNAPRKFLFGPDVVRIPASAELGIVLGTGDREKPLVSYGAATAVQNYFFSFTDKPTTATTWMDVSTDCTYDQICLDKLTTVATGTAFNPNTTVSSYGLKLPLTAGEQVVSGTLTIADIANFSTHIPADPIAFADPNSPQFCKNNLGTATTYNVNYQNAQGDTVKIIGGGLVPTPVAGKVILDDGTIVPFCIGCGGDNSAIGGSSVGSGVTWVQPKSRVYWNIQQ